MKNLLLTFCLIISLTATAQRYSDQAFLQDRAEKFDLNEETQNIALLQIASDRNKAIKILSENGLLHPYEKKIKKDFEYRPLTDMHIVALRRYQEQFIYLTDKAVLSNAWAGKF